MSIDMLSPFESEEIQPPPTPVRGRTRLIWDVTDSINYTPPTNNVALARNNILERTRQQRIFGITGRTFTAVVTTVIAGMMIGITARVMEAGIDLSVAYSNSLLNPVLKVNPWGAIRLHLILASSSVLLTAAVVQWLAPGAAGAGVSLVIALLNGNNIAGLLTPAVYVVKLLGTCVSRMAGLALGPEAPMVHLGACVASLIFALERRLWGKRESLSNWNLDLKPAFSNSSHREMVSAGTAAGLAAAFGAPIGGVLFALEEACSVWSKKTAWRCLLCTATAVFTMSQLMPSLAGGGILSLSGIYPLSSRQWLKQLPFVVAVSAGAGLLGAIFNLMRRGMQSLRAARRRHWLRLLEAAVVASITVLITAGASVTVGQCLDLPATWKEDDVIQWSCPDGQYNDLATALLGSSPFVVRSLLGLGSETEPINLNNICTLMVPCYFSLGSLATLCVVYVCLMVLSSGLAVPGGLFMPSVIVGGSFGAVCGMLLTAVLPPSWDVQPGVYAMVGATATMAAVFRSSISLVVIIVEGTRGIEFLPGILAATIISNFIAHWIHPDGVYESELERDGRVFFLRQEPPGALRWTTASTIMASPVLGLKRIEEVSRVVEVLKSTLHNGFPVYPAGQSMDARRSNRLDGFILRTQLLVLLQERAFCDAYGNYLVPPQNVQQHEAYLDALMQATECSCDGLGGAAEMALAVDPLGPTSDSGEKGGVQEVAAAMLPTLETLETLRTLPSLVRCLDEEHLLAPTASNLASLGSPLLAESRPEAQRAVHWGRSDSLPLRSPPRPSPRTVPGMSPRSAAPVLYLNLGPFMDQGMLTVRPDTPCPSLHKMFVAMSLRHLCVVDKDGCVVGMITRKDLDNAAGHGWWRLNKMAPSPAREGNFVPRSRSWFGASFQALMHRLNPSSAAASTVDGESPQLTRTLSASAGGGGGEGRQGGETAHFAPGSWPQRYESIL